MRAARGPADDLRVQGVDAFPGTSIIVVIMHAHTRTLWLMVLSDIQTA